MIHHTGKSKDQRGHTNKLDQLDIEFRLYRPEGHKIEDGLLLVVENQKARSIPGGKVKPFEAQLLDTNEYNSVTKTYDICFSWKRREIFTTRNDRIMELYRQGLTQKEIALEIGVHQTTVGRIIREQKKVIERRKHG